MQTPSSANRQLTSTLGGWVFEPYCTDAALDRVVRVAAVEAMLLSHHGPLHVPDREGNERYFAIELDARLQRRWIAQRIVDEQDWRDRFEAIASQQHGAVLPTMREVAETQAAEFAATGRVTRTGFESLDAMLAEDARRAQAKISGTEAA